MSTLYPTDSNDLRPRPGTIIWGVITVVIAALILIGELTGLVFDPVLVVMILLIGAGAALIVGGILSMNRRK